MCQKHSADRRPARCHNTRECKCSFTRVDDPICRLHGVSCLYRCILCNRYHVCTGGSSCLVINTGENMVCVLTGNCIIETMQDTRFCCPQSDINPSRTDRKFMFNNILASVKADIAHFFSDSARWREIYAQISADGHLNNKVSCLIDSTFEACHHLFGDIPYAYSLVCSMYIHIIISIFSTKTVYGPLLFKCTKNKKYDALVKQIRETWMSTLTMLD